MSGAPHARAVLRDVFRLSGRGIVLAVDGLEGSFRIGDTVRIGALETTVTGIEMINPAPPEPRRSFGFSVGSTDDAPFREAVGAPVFFASGV